MASKPVVGAPRLGQIEPRERAGARTGRKYEYQYERTALAALDLLTDGPAYVCVYCDWHDDFVVEVSGAPTCYRFHQVKGRKSSQGPWAYSEFFGVRLKKTKKPSKNPAAVVTDAILPRMLLHHNNFRESCAGLAFVTNSGLESTLSGFLQAIHSYGTFAELPDAARMNFDNLAAAYGACVPCLASSPIELFSRLRTLAVYHDQGQLESEDAALLELADLIVKYSEVELFQRQAKQIAREIVSVVRRKVAHSSTVVPASDDQLQRDKGVIVADLLAKLSLSTEAYEQLKSGAASDTVKTLSRLHRFCKKNDMEASIAHICQFKASWDSWRTIARHSLRPTDYVVLEERARDVLKAAQTLHTIVAEAQRIAADFRDVTPTPLMTEHVVGLIFSLAAQSEAIGDG